MTPKSVLLTFLLGLSLLGVTACMKSQVPLPLRHPADVGKAPPRCSACHEAALNSYDHLPAFAERHGQQARQSSAPCGLCHATTFCDDCHALRGELTPALRREAETYRQLPHRGDYRTRHRIDGRIDPSSCFRCHGNPKNAQTCAPCHG